MNEENRQQAWEQWLREKRSVVAPTGFADRCLERIEQDFADPELAREIARSARNDWLSRVTRSRWRQWAICGGALAVGILPYAALLLLLGGAAS